MDAAHIRIVSSIAVLAVIPAQSLPPAKAGAGSSPPAFCSCLRPVVVPAQAGIQ